jgi:ankyrin repeat protein
MTDSISSYIKLKSPKTQFSLSLIYLLLFINGCTNIHDVIRTLDIQQVKNSISSANINAKDDKGLTPLMIALSSDLNRDLYLLKSSNRWSDYWDIIKRSTEISRVLIDNGADINAKTDQGTTVLMIAVSNQRYEIARLLVSKGANINARNVAGDTALKWLLYEFQWDWSTYATLRQEALRMLRFMIENGADLNVRDERGLNPLMVMLSARRTYCFDNFGEVIKYLIDKGTRVNVDEVNRDGNTLLFLAAKNDNFEMVNYVLEKGANVIDVDREGNTALMLAAKNGSKRSAEYLRKYGAQYKRGKALLLLSEKVIIQVNSRDNATWTNKGYELEPGSHKLTLMYSAASSDYMNKTTTTYKGSPISVTLDAEGGFIYKIYPNAGLNSWGANIEKY